jgi:DNA-binding CsgD family transcriptional regulator
VEVLTRPECERPYIPIAGRVEVAAVRIADALPAHQPVGAGRHRDRAAAGKLPWVSALAEAAGAAGFLLKDSAPADIVRAIQAVHAGEGSLSPAIARRLIALVAGDRDTAARNEQARQQLASLTAREHQVAAAIGQGLSNADIARQLHMSPATVKAHVSRLLIKLNAANRVQIALLVQGAATSRPPSSR